MMVQERMVGGDRRKRARRTATEATIVPLDYDDDDDDEDRGDTSPRTPATPAYAAASSSAPSHLVTDSSSTARPVNSPPSPPPLAFLCPLTLSIMYDPVLDREGNSFERSALLDYLRIHSISPVSRRPLHPEMLVPNHALRQLIHHFMGSEWVQRKKAAESNPQSDSVHATRASPGASSSPCPYRDKMSRVLDALAPGNLGGPVAGATLLPLLTLNGEGSAAFQCQGVVVVLDVPRNVGLLHLYTRQLVLNPSRKVQQHMLELNFLQGETRGGCLSIKRSDDGGTSRNSKGESGSCEVVFSYNDRVDEVTCRDVRNILLNFVETALSLKAKFEKMMQVDADIGSSLTHEDEGA